MQAPNRIAVLMRVQIQAGKKLDSAKWFKSI